MAACASWRAPTHPRTKPHLLHAPAACARTQHALGGGVKPGDSIWTLEDGVLTIQLAKAEEVR